MNYGKGYRDCIKRNGDKTLMQSTCYIVTSCHGNNDEMWSTSYLIMQHKPYIVELRFSETQKSNDSINEGLSIAMDGPSQTNVVHVACMMSHVETIGQNLSLISNHILPIPVICLLAWHSYTYSEEYSSTLDHSLPNGCSHIYLLYLPLHLHCEKTLLIEICHLCITAQALKMKACILVYFCVMIVAIEGMWWWLLNNIGLVLHNQA